MQTFKVLVSNAKSSLTIKDQKIVQYLNLNEVNSENLTINSIIDYCHVGYSTVYSFLDKLGLKNMKELILAVKSDELTNKMLDSNFNISNSEEKLFSIYHELIATNMKQINFKNLKLTANEILKKKSIYLIGFGESNLAVQTFSNRLLRFGFKSHVGTTEVGLLLVLMNTLTPDDLLICVSMSGKTKHIVEAAKIAQRKGVKVISVSETQNSPLENYSDIMNVIYYPPLNEPYESFVSQLVPISIFWDRLTQEIVKDSFQTLSSKRQESSELITKATKLKS